MVHEQTNRKPETQKMHSMQMTTYENKIVLCLITIATKSSFQ